MKALIGYSGYVGSTLVKQTNFDEKYRSTNIHEISGKSFDLVVCAGAPAQKWLANKEPAADLIKIQNLIDRLQTIKTKKFILISTVDVFKNPLNVNENTPIHPEDLQAYGLNRLRLETFVKETFADHLIVRLPGLVGPGLRKNIIFDFLNNNNLSAIDYRGVFQFYPMVNLWPDIQLASENALKVVHLTAEPISVSEVAQKGFGLSFEQTTITNPAQYDFQSIHAELFGGANGYQYSKKETLLTIRAFAQSEPLSLKAQV